MSYSSLMSNRSFISCYCVLWEVLLNGMNDMQIHEAFHIFWHLPCSSFPPANYTGSLLPLHILRTLCSSNYYLWQPAWFLSLSYFPYQTVSNLRAGSMYYICLELSLHWAFSTLLNRIMIILSIIYPGSKETQSTLDNISQNLTKGLLECKVHSKVRSLIALNFSSIRLKLGSSNSYT